MAFDAGTVKGQLDLDAAKFIAELKRVEGRLDAVERESKQAEQSVGFFGSGVVKAAAGLAAATAGFFAFRSAIHATVAGLTNASTTAAQFEQVVQKLSVSLGQAGAKNIGSFVEEMKAYAAEIQRTTSFSDNFVLEVSQLLTVLGVSQDKLQEYTKAVLDYAAATGSDAVNAARQFGKTFGGTLGELAESLPALKAVSQEELKLGGAFKFAEQAFGGFAEKVGNTSQGLSDRLRNTTSDFSKSIGAILNPFLNELKRSAIEVVSDLTDAANENREALGEVFRSFALKLVDAIPAALDAITSLRVGFAEAVATFSSLGPIIAGTFGQLALSVTEAHLAVNSLFAKFGDKGAEESLATLQEKVDELRGTVDAAAEEYGAIRRETDAATEAAKRQGDELKNRILPLLDQAKEKIRGISTAFAEGDDSAKRVGTSTGKAAVNTQELAEAATQARVALAQAADEASALDDAAAGAADSISSAAGAAAGGRQGGTRAGLNLSDPFSALAALESARRTQQQAAFSPYSFVRRSAANVTAQVQAAAQAQINKALSDFTDDLVAELNRQGVFNPNERQSYISQRVAEAQRLGILPKQTTATSLGARSGIA